MTFPSFLRSRAHRPVPAISDTMGARFGFDIDGQFAIELWQDMRGLFDDGDGQAAIVQGLGHFQADEPAAHDGRHRGLERPESLQGTRCPHGTHAKDVGRAGHCDGRNDGRRTGSEDEFVVGEGFFGSAGDGARRAAFWKAGRSPGPPFAGDVDVVALLHFLRVGDQELFFLQDARRQCDRAGHSWRRK